MSKISIVKHVLLASTAALVFTMPAQAQTLDRAMQVAKSSTAASAASQQRVETLDDDADSMIRDYRAILQQIDNIKLFVDQQDIYLDSQKAELASLARQLDTVEAIKQGMAPMMLRMTVAIEDSIEADLPFMLIERRARIARVKSALSNPDVTPVEQYRQVLNAFKIEVSYGQGLYSYEGPHPTKSGMKVNYLRYGRVALVYMTKDESEIASYDLASQSWQSVDAKNALEIRQAIRVAKGEAAPKLVLAPLLATN
ncbi:MAG: hypothetical protein COA69_01835 [Robiginitomaculum sp.]|nr:MAG: hypothetical protein COA69_01835 [Robiginitomaculum sp.]